MEHLGHHVVGELGKPLRILQLTDLHHFPAWCTEFDVRAAKGRVVPIPGGFDTTPGGYSTSRDLSIISDVIARVGPDLVVLTGDIVDGRPFDQVSKDSGVDPGNGWRSTLLEVLAPVTAAGVAWTFTPGNHDDDGHCWSREALLGAYQLGSLAPGCVSQGARSFNHTLTVGPSSDPSDASSVRLWLFDSGGNHLEDPSLRYHTFQPEAVSGFQALVAAQPKPACGLAYFHIPLPQCNGLAPVFGQNRLFEKALGAGKVPRPWRWEPFTSVARMAGKTRITGSSKLESGLFDALVRSGSVRACFFGHDHASDAVYMKDGLYMAYGRVGGTSPPVDWEGDAPLPFEVGARVVEWDPASPQRGLRTWIETASGPETGSLFVMDGASRPPRTSRGMLWAALVIVSIAIFLALLAYS